MKDLSRNVKLYCNICGNNQFEFSPKSPIVWKEIGRASSEKGTS